MYSKGGESEVWVAGSGGEDTRRVAGPEAGTRYSELEWTPDGRRASWIKYREGEDPALETCDATGGPPSVVFRDSRLRRACWTPDGSVILSLAEAHPNDTSHNLWELRVDGRGQRARGRPRRITNWVGAGLAYLSITADGRRLAFGRLKAVADVYISDLDKNGDALANRRRFTAADRTSWPTAWTPDSRAILFHSDRIGSFDIYRQGLSVPMPETLAGGRGEQFQGQFSPDGTSILYLEWDPDRPDQGRLIRSPLSGDPPQPLFSLSGRPIVSQREHHSGSRLHTNVYPSFRCPPSLAGRCVVAEVQQGQVVFTAFDAATGARREILNTKTDPSLTYWDLSPDGSRIAFGKRGRTLAGGGYLRIITVANGSVTEVRKDQAQWDGVGWAADGASLFVNIYQATGCRLVHVMLDGKVTELYRTINWLDRPVVSRDGRRLAFSEITYDSNVWMLEGFR